MEKYGYMLTYKLQDNAVKVKEYKSFMAERSVFIVHDKDNNTDLHQSR